MHERFLPLFGWRAAHLLAPADPEAEPAKTPQAAAKSAPRQLPEETARQRAASHAAQDVEPLVLALRPAGHAEQLEPALPTPMPSESSESSVT